MSPRQRIIATVVALWVAAVGAAAWYYSQHPYYVQHDHPVRDTGNPFDDFYSEHFPATAFWTAVAIATGVAVVAIVIATTWTATKTKDA